MMKCAEGSDADSGAHINLYGKHCKVYETVSGKDITHKRNGMEQSSGRYRLTCRWGVSGICGCDRGDEPLCL